MWELIRANRRRSLYLLGALGVFMAAVGGILCVAVVPGAPVWFGATVALVVWAVLSLISFFSGDAAALYFSGAKEASSKDYRRLNNILDELTIASGLPRPKIYVVETKAMNAFAVGRAPEKAAVAVTRGLLERLNRDELTGVLAHEMGHIKNRDTLYMIRATLMVGTIALLCDFFLRTLYFGGVGGRTRRGRGGSRDGSPVVLILAVLLSILAPLLAQMLYLCISRRREYLADATAVEFTRYPEGLASALEKIADDTERLESANRATAPLYIVNPLRKTETRKANSVMSTHPPLHQRIAVLRTLAGGATLNDYERAYRLQKIGGQGGGLFPARTLSEVSAARARRTARGAGRGAARVPGRPPREALEKTAAEAASSKPVGSKKMTTADAENLVKRLRPAIAAGAAQAGSPTTAAAVLMGGPLAGGLFLLGCPCGRRLSFTPGTPLVLCPACGTKLKTPPVPGEKTGHRKGGRAAPRLPFEKATPSADAKAAGASTPGGKTPAGSMTTREPSADAARRAARGGGGGGGKFKRRGALGDWSDDAEKKRARRQAFEEAMERQKRAEEKKRTTAVFGNRLPPEDPGDDEKRRALVPKVLECECGRKTPIPKDFKGSRARCPGCSKMHVFYLVNGR